MRKFGKRLAVLGLAVLTAVLAAGCGKKESSSAGEEKKELTYAKGSGPYTILFEEHIIPILENQGYTFKVSELSLQYADEAIADGDVDFSVEQHIAYMNAFNKSTMRCSQRISQLYLRSLLHLHLFLLFRLQFFRRHIHRLTRFPMA